MTSLHGQDSSTKGTILHQSPQRLMSVMLDKLGERCQWSAVPFFGVQISAAVVTVMLICACEPLPSIFEWLAFLLGVLLFEACDAPFIYARRYPEITLFAPVFSTELLRLALNASDTRTRRARTQTKQVDLVVLSEDPR